ncbi:hypothetical protein RRM46_002283 [Flavobacterium psychrophilum]|nr:hypothetical protein [Flavobacterium psychrophilum]
MERRITEEKVTKLILDWLESNDWKIICYDFPQSGTGISLHLNEELRETKNKGAVIPDIVAIKEEKVLFFENKDRFVLSDFDKLNSLKTNNNYSESIEKLLTNYDFSAIYYGIGIPKIENQITKVKNEVEKVDFVIFVNSDKEIEIYYEKSNLF